jgi:glyoxalase family protein
MDGLTTRGFHHVTLVSADAERALWFYRDLLGLGLIERTNNGDAPSAGRLYFGEEGGRPGTLLTVAEARDGETGRGGGGGVHHVALGVDTEAAQLKWKRRLMDAGVAVTGPYDRGYFTSIYFRDPDGQVLEIATAGPGYTVDEPLHELGMRLQEPDPKLLRGNRDEPAIAARTWPEPVGRITPDMRLDGIHHVSGITDDIELALDWYPATLGLHVVKRTVNRDDGRTRHYFWAALADDGGVAPHSSFTLFGWPGSTYRARPGVGQMRRVAFRAGDGGQLRAWRDHLLRLNVDVGPVRDRVFYESVRFTAPDGMPLEIATDGPAFTADGPDEEMSQAIDPGEWREPGRPETEPSLSPLRPGGER